MESNVRLCKRSVPRLGVGTSSRVVMIISTTRARDATKSRAAKMELSYNRFSQPPHNCNNKNVVLVFSYVNKKKVGELSLFILRQFLFLQTKIGAVIRIHSI